ncbi:MAG: putative fluoride ion transporter CrcB [Candidatus Kapaibacterium sp.]|nr:MAG: putative fluoride ion transporter CrcB [Candidatus Kapabacteria bacterium]
MMRNVVLVGVGGMLGSIARYGVAVFFSTRMPLGFPYGTLTVNIVGCFLIGVVVGLAGRGNFVTPEVRLFLATGFCGGFTTFSSFAYEVVEMVKAHRYELAVAYVVGSVVVGIGATVVGLMVTR